MSPTCPSAKGDKKQTWPQTGCPPGVSKAVSRNVWVVEKKTPILSSTVNGGQYRLYICLCQNVVYLSALMPAFLAMDQLSSASSDDQMSGPDTGRL